MNQLDPDRPARCEPVEDVAEALLQALAKEPVPPRILELAERLQAALDARARDG